MIDMCASHDKNEDHSECAIIVLTHTDLIDEAQRDRTIQEYKNEIIEHVQSKHTCKYVHPTVFDLGNHDESGKELHSLQRAIVEKFESNHCKGANGNPLSWLKLEADILKFFAEKDRRCLSLKQQTVRKSYGMSMERLKSFLQFHFPYRNLIFDESAMDVLDNEHCTNTSCMITDPLLIDQTFSAIISLWEQRDLPELSLIRRQRIDLDVKHHLVALSTLEYLCKLNNAHVVSVERLAKLLVSFNLLIPHKSLEEPKYLVPAVMSSFVNDSVCNIFEELGDLRPLIYRFHKSTDFHYKEVSGFSASEFFCKLVSIWKESVFKEQTWDLLHMHSDSAAFRVGPQGQFLAHITCHTCALVLKLDCIPKSMPENLGNLIPQIRWFIEDGIQFLIKDLFPGLQCSVCVSPCDDTPRFQCLHELGEVGSEINQLRFAICRIHGKTLHPDKFSRWFHLDSGQHNVFRNTFRKKQEQVDIKTLRTLARKVGDKSTLMSLALALEVKQEKVDIRMSNSPRDFETATFEVLFKDWYCNIPGTLVEGSVKLGKLQLAMKDAGLSVFM